jgi:urea transport system substrate-binding protein
MSQEILGGRYAMIRLLGQGGMGAVYEARHTSTGRRVAVKLITADLLRNPDLATRFEVEARAAGCLESQHIAAVLDAGRDAVRGAPFLVMEYLVGEDLSQLLTRVGALPVDVALRIAAQACRGLEKAHQAGIVHRDIKPANIFLSTRDGDEVVVKLVDFGIAKIAAERQSTDGGTHLTRTGTLLGSPQFMSPEQARGDAAVDHRADLWSLGVVLHKALTGRTPHHSIDGLGALLMAICSVPTAPVERIAPWVPTEVARVVEKALALDPAARFQAAEEMSRALKALLPGGHALTTSMLGPSTEAGLASVVVDTAPGAEQLLTTCAPVPSTLGTTGAVVHEVHSSSTARPARSRTPFALGLVGLVVTMGVVAYFVPRPLTTSAARAPVEVASPQPASSAPPAAPAPEPSTIKVGILHSMSGTMAFIERPVVDATHLAIDEVNAEGGVLGRRIEAVVDDGQSDDATFAREAEKLINEDRVVTIFGGWTSSSRKTITPILERLGGLLIYPAQYEGLEESPNIVYLGATPNQQILPALRFCAEKLGARRFFFVGSDSVFPRVAAEIARDEVSALRGQIVGEHYALPADTNFSRAVQSIKSARPDVILNTVSGDSNVAFFRALRRAGITPQQIPTVSFSITMNSVRQGEIPGMAGDYLSWAYFEEVESPENKGFVARFKKVYGANRSVTAPMEVAYAGVRLWADAVRAAGVDRGGAIHQAMSGRSYAAPEGLIRIDPSTFHTWRQSRMGKIKDDGSVEIVATSREAVEPIPFPVSRTRAEWEAFLAHLSADWKGGWSNPQKPTLLR